jgi:hypothetical protein
MSSGANQAAVASGQLSHRCWIRLIEIRRPRLLPGSQPGLTPDEPLGPETLAPAKASARQGIANFGVKSTRVSEWKSIETLFSDWRLTTTFVASLPGTAAVAAIWTRDWAWGALFCVATLLVLVIVPIAYRASERGRTNRSLRRKLYFASLPLNIGLVFVLSDRFSLSATFIALALFASAFLAGLVSAEEPRLRRNKNEASR